ncbi:MAG: pyridoxal phosphate-dependent aminotransferase [Brevinemataceae bacterium]
MSFSEISKKIQSLYYLNQKKMITEFQKTDPNVEVINLSVAETDLNPPIELIESLQRCSQDSIYNRYQSAAGIPELRSKFAEWGKQEYHFDMTSENSIVTSGARGAIFVLMQCLLNPGDEVLVPCPYWGGYIHQINIAGAVPKPVILDEEEGFYPEIEKFESACSHKTKMLILNNPHNPTGNIWDKEAIKKILTWAEQKNIFVLVDEVCCIEIFDDNKFISAAEINGSFKNIAIVRSFSKNLSIPGWRIGWMLTDKEIIQKAEAFSSYTTGGVHSVSQYALVDCWEHLMPWLKKQIIVHQERRDALYQELSKIHGFRTAKPQGSITMFSNIRYYLGNEVGGEVPQTSQEFANIVFKKTGVVVSSGDSLGMEGFIRTCFSYDGATLRKGIQKIASILEK